MADAKFYTIAGTVTVSRVPFMGNARGAAVLRVLKLEDGTEIGTTLKAPNTRSTRTGFAGSVGIGQSARHVLSSFDHPTVVHAVAAAWRAANPLPPVDPLAVLEQSWHDKGIEGGKDHGIAL